MQKMQKIFKKICIYQKKAVPLHRQIKRDTKTKTKINQLKPQSYEQDLHDTKLWRNPTDNRNN